MSLDVQFAFVCRRQFAELAGDSDFKRFCATCQTEVVNLDPLDDESRLKLFEEAERTGVTPCVSATTLTPGGQECAGTPHSPPFLPRTAGIPMMPENLREERERIERLRRPGLLARLKFW